MNYETTTQKRQQTCFTTIIPVLAVRRPSVNPPTHTVLFSGQPEISCTILSPLSLGPT